LKLFGFDRTVVITVIKKGRQWEVAEPQYGCMVPDCCGVLILRDPGVGVPL
jgi:hypothetical protein